ncbi:hypothetical protein ACPUEX_22435 [Enterobacter vonholyi]
MFVLDKENNELVNILKTNSGIDFLEGFILSNDLETENVHSVLKVLDYTVLIYMSQKRGSKLKLTARIFSDYNPDFKKTKDTELINFDLKKNNDDRYINANDLAETIITNLPNLIFDFLFRKDNALYNILSSNCDHDFHNKTRDLIKAHLVDINSYIFQLAPADDLIFEQDNSFDEKPNFVYEEF